MYLPVTQLAKLLADGSITPQQLSAAFRERLQRYDDFLHTVVTYTAGLAAQQAGAAQQQLAAASSGSGSQASGGGGGGHNSLLLGVPYGLKDLFAVPGYPTTWGLWALRNRTIAVVRVGEGVDTGKQAGRLAGSLETGGGREWTV